MRRQCNKCPWRVDVDPFDIPNGYCPVKHKDLKDTIAPEGQVPIPGSLLRLMVCHESKHKHEKPCVGWLANQLGIGNNIGLRMAAIRDKTLTNFVLVGEQHERFQDTLPSTPIPQRR